MRFFQRNETVAARRTIFAQMVAEDDRVTPVTGVSPAAGIVKAGEAGYAPIGGSVVEIGYGTYRVDLAIADLDVEGEAMLRVTATGAAPQHIPILVVRFFDEVHLAKAALVNVRTHTIDTGVDRIRDDDGATVLRTLTPSETDGVVTVTPD